MQNQLNSKIMNSKYRPSKIPLPIRPVRGNPQPLLPPRTQQKSIETEHVVLITEDNLNAIKRDYEKAVFYINSCHRSVNRVIKKNHPDQTGFYLLPRIKNFVLPLLPSEIEKTKRKKKTLKPIAERKTKSSFAIRKTTKLLPDPIPGNNVIILYFNPALDFFAVGDCSKEDQYKTLVADILKAEIPAFLNTIRDDLDKAINESKSRSRSCRDLNIGKQKLDSVIKICSLEKNEKEVENEDSLPIRITCFYQRKIDDF